MTPLEHALRGARHPAAPGAPLAPVQSLLLVGAGGALGSAVLAEALVAGRFGAVAAVVAAPLASTLKGLVPVPRAALSGDPAAAAAALPFVPDAAAVVFDRERRSNGRDDVFWLPTPADLVALATRLRAAGVRRLVVVVPHAPALLPQALAVGLANLDEAELAALGFEHLVLVRAARPGEAAPAREPWLARVARLWLAQLRFMVPERQQPQRTVALARLLVELARALPQAPAGTRVIAPEALWDAVREHENAATLPGPGAAARPRPPR